ncbi:uncharacterized protein PAC_02571 [Phialocephala subalpina]|uniref:Uncharacterized protein n=1 Tax=Phialocephala subalpina TaxID=576137 RepID=A0A1L7WIV1_9HELO|nr:uncharacterized protein PAC_02571 [Phialocephala subalpina]
MADYPIRPQTPQAMLHRLPDKPDPASSEGHAKPTKYIILIEASTTVPGKVQIAKAVSNALSCPLFQGDSMHETSAKAAKVGAARRPTGIDNDEQIAPSGANEAQYQRMWLSKMTRTGLLFPEESRPATEGFSGFGGASSTSTSRRGSTSSVTSSSSEGMTSTSSIASSFMSSGAPTTKYINKPVAFTPSEDEKLRKSNPALMIVTHPNLEKWHKDYIRKAVGEYGIGVIFVPLCEDSEPVLKPLDPRTMTSFASLGSFGAAQKAAGPTLDEEIVLKVNVQGNVEDVIEDVVDGVQEIMNS